MIATIQSPPARSLVSFHLITKRFGQTLALGELSLDGLAGSVHAITGENGAGKSTLMNLLAGVYQPDAGEIRLRERAIRIENPRHAHRLGISTIFQELTLLPNLTVAENLFLGRELVRTGMIDRHRMRRQARGALDRVRGSVSVGSYCGDLSVAEQQLVEIAKGIMADADVFILDEPTAALNALEVDVLGDLIGSLKAAGKLVFYISHRLDEIFRFCDTVSVLKDGRHVATQPTGSLTHERLISLMVGRPLGQLYPRRAARRSTPARALDVFDLAPLPDRRVSFAINRGEITGLAGLQGQGQREIIRALAGVRPHVAGRVVKHGSDGRARDVELSIMNVARSGIGFVPEDRKAEGLYLPLSIEQNIALGMFRRLSLWRHARVDKPRIGELMEAMKVHATGTRQAVASLSGGNQQKIMIGRWLASAVDVLLIEEPTRGVDVGAKAEIYALLRRFADSGDAVLITSSELTEMLGLCDRILVVRDGQIVADVNGLDVSEEDIMRHALAASSDPIEARQTP